MLAYISFVGCLGCAWIGYASWARYQNSESADPIWLWQSVMGYLGSALNLVAAVAVIFL
jgi:hypothetical protein